MGTVAAYFVANPLEVLNHLWDGILAESTRSVAHDF